MGDDLDGDIVPEVLLAAASGFFSIVVHHHLRSIEQTSDATSVNRSFDKASGAKPSPSQGVEARLLV